MLVGRKVIVKWEDNWADEMDLNGFVIMKEEDWNRFLVYMGNIDYEIVYCIGTNEEITYANGNEALNYFEMEFITSDQAQVFEDLNITTSGFSGPGIMDFLYDIQDLEECNYSPEYQSWDKEIYKPKKVSVSYKVRNWIKRTEDLAKAGYEKTYTGKTGETWELKGIK